MTELDLTTDEWRFISVLLAEVVRSDKERGLVTLTERHEATWQKIQPACEWDDD